MDAVRIWDQPGFRRFWIASTVSDVGTPVTTLAIQLLVVVTLEASATEVGVVSGARWLPYLLLGLLVGVLADRVRRRRVLVATDLARAAVLVAVPVLTFAGLMSVPLLAAFMALFGLLSLMNDAVHQSFVPQLVPAPLLPRAWARLEQSSSAAQTAGPAAAGVLVSWVGAPLAVLVDALSYLASAALTATLPVHEARPPRPPGGRRPPRDLVLELGRDLREGLSWVYRHPRLMPFATTSHGWFLFFSMFNTVYAPFALREVGVGAAGLGLTLAALGLGGVLGSGLAERIALRIGVVRIVAGSWALQAGGFAVIALAPAASAVDAAAHAGAPGAWPAVAMLAAGQFVAGFGFGAGCPIEMAYRQAVTPDRLQGRMNGTMRSLNRAAIVVGAPLGGVLADVLGLRVALWIGLVGVGLCAVVLRLSPFRHARLDDRPPGPEPGRMRGPRARVNITWDTNGHDRARSCPAGGPTTEWVVPPVRATRRPPPWTSRPRRPRAGRPARSR